MQKRISRNQIEPGRPRKGQATVEFALIFVVLMALIFGILEVSRLVFISAEIDNAAREGAHYAALNNVDPPGLAERAVAHANFVNFVKSKLTLADPALVDVALPEYGPNSDVRCKFCNVTVEVSYPWESVVPLLNLGTINLQATATKLIE